MAARPFLILQVPAGSVGAGECYVKIGGGIVHRYAEHGTDQIAACTGKQRKLKYDLPVLFVYGYTQIPGWRASSVFRQVRKGCTSSGLRRRP